MINKELPNFDKHLSEFFSLCTPIDTNKDEEVNSHLEKVSIFISEITNYIISLYQENEIQKINEKLNLLERAINQVNQTLLNDIVIYNNDNSDKEEWEISSYEFDLYLLDHVIKDLFKQIIGSIALECFAQKLNPNLFGSFIFSQNIDLSKNLSTNRTSFKTQILILKELGVFNLPSIQDLTLEKRGEFFSRLLNRSFDNAKDYIGNIYDKKGEAGNKSPYNIQSKKQAKEILSLIGISSNL